MKRLKLIVLTVLTGAALAACSDTPYTSSYPALNTYNGYQTGYPTGMNTMYPYSTYGYSTYAMNPFLYSNLAYTNTMRAQMQARAMAMFSIRFRATTPMFYYPNYVSNNCRMRTQVNYTPTQCACVRAPCDCQQVITQVRQQSRQVCPVVRTTRSTVANTTGNTTPNTTTNTTANNTSDSGNSDTVLTTNSSTRMSLSLINADARALYERLAIAEEALQNKTKVRTGANYKCMLSGKAKKDENYACDFDLNLEDGSLYQQYPVGNAGQPVNTSSSLFMGDNVTVGGPGLAPEEGFIKFSGRMASVAFERLPMQAVSGTIDTAGRVQAEIKTGKSLKCYKTTNTATPKVECAIKIKSDTGEALSAQ